MYLGPINAEWVLLIVIAIVGFIVQAKLQSVFKKYSKVMFPGGLTGKDVAERMLHDNGIYDVKVVSTPGHLTDHYNPATKTVNLSESVYSSNSVAAAAVAAHECGHAVQHAREYAPLKMRSALVPVVSFSSQWAMWVIIAGMLLLNTYPALFWIGIGMIAVSAVFSIITLPVEYNASARAMEWLTGSYTLKGEQAAQANRERHTRSSRPTSCLIYAKSSTTRIICLKPTMLRASSTPTTVWCPIPSAPPSALPVPTAAAEGLPCTGGKLTFSQAKKKLKLFSKKWLHRFRRCV